MKKRVLSVALVFVFVFAAMGVASFVPKNPPLTAAAATLLPYQDTSLSFEERAADLVSRMTTDEKWPQFGSNNPAISRLGVKAYDYWTEGLHGVARLGPATSFPVSLAMGSTWNPDLMLQTATATADEARGYANGTGRGVNYFSPTINLARDPRWGRTDESFSEDPYLTSMMGAQFVDGFQGTDPKYEKVNATIKHYAANNSEFNRETGNSVMDSRTFLEYYTRAFKYISLNTRVSSVMGSYNEVNGVPSTANYYMMTQLLRKEWGFSGFVVSDCGAIEDIFQTANHHFQPDTSYLSTLPGNGAAYVDANGYATPAGGSAMALLAGTDLCCGNAYPTYLKSAWQAGLVTMGEIDTALRRIFTSRFKTGEFDPKADVPYNGDAYSQANQVESAAHKQLAEDAADQALVLLKNDKAATADTAPILPLDPAKKNVVMVGNFAEMCTLGGYSGSPSEQNCSSPRQGVEAILGQPVTSLPIVTGGSNNIFNVKNVYLKDSTGATIKTLTPSQATALSGGGNSIRIENNGANLGYIINGDTFSYTGLNLSSVTSLSVETSGPANTLQGQLEFHLGSATGALIASVTTTATGGWDQWRTFTSAVTGVTGQTAATIVAVVKGNASVVGSTSGYVMNMRNVVFQTAAGSTTLKPTDATVLNACQVENPTSAAPNFGYVARGAYVAYPNVNLAGLTQISIETSGLNDTIQGNVEFRWNSPVGPLIGTVTSTATGSWTTWLARATTAVDLHGQTTGTLYAVVKANGVTLNLTQTQKDAISGADAVVLCVGTDTGDSAEGNDRKSLDLPNNQSSLVDAVTALNPRVILYIQSVGMVNVEDFKDKVPAILWCSYNGQAQGNAFARTLFGRNDPSGRLPFTWYAAEYQIPNIADYSIRSTDTSDGRTYQYFTGDVTYPFGYGLSYTSFTLSNQAVSKAAVAPDDTFNVTADVKNTGTAAGSEVVQVYVSAPTHDGQDRPLKQLKGFTKVSLAAGESKSVTIPMNVSDWYFTDPVTGNETFDQGAYTVEIGTTSADADLVSKAVTLSGALTPKVQNVYCSPDKVVLNTDNKDTTSAAAAATLNDDSALDLSKATVTYTSSSPAMASVSADGTVTPLSPGTALITATVTYNGTSKSDSFPVVVTGTPVTPPDLVSLTLSDSGVTVTGQFPAGSAMNTQLITDQNNQTYTGIKGFINQNQDIPQIGAMTVYKMTYTANSAAFSPTDPVTIEISLPDGFPASYSGLQVFSFDPSTGAVTQVPDVSFSTNGKTVKFTGDGNLSYALASLLGDVDFSGKIDTVDARMVLQNIVKKLDFDPQQAINADVNGDNKIDTVDARLILQFIVNKSTRFPIGE